MKGGISKVKNLSSVRKKMKIFFFLFMNILCTLSSYIKGCGKESIGSPPHHSLSATPYLAVPLSREATLDL